MWRRSPARGCPAIGGAPDLKPPGGRPRSGSWLENSPTGHSVQRPLIIARKPLHSAQCAASLAVKSIGARVQLPEEDLKVRQLPVIGWKWTKKAQTTEPGACRVRVGVAA